MSKLIPIKAIIVKPVSIPLHTAFAISNGSIETAKNVIVICEDESGLKGIGEAAPFPVLTGDNSETCFSALHEMAKYPFEKNARTSLEIFYKKIFPDFRQFPSACAAMEMALWDLQAQQMGVPFSHLWGFHSQATAHTDITLPITPILQIEAFCKRFKKHEFPYVKIKVGMDSVNTDVERVLELIKHMPPGTRVSLDGNQGCSIESSIAMLSKLEKLNIKPLFFEQPLPAEDWRGMTMLTASSPIPICADETVKTPADAIRVVNEKCAHIVNLKLMKSGLLNTHKIISIVRSAGLELMIGGMVETEVAMTASLHVLCGSGEISWCDLDTPFFLAERITVNSPYHSNSSVLECPRSPGIGLALK